MVCGECGMVLHMKENARVSWLTVTAICLLLCCVLYASTRPVGGVDFWLQAKIGEIILDRGAIPQTLEFPFTEIASERFNAHEWLVSILFSLALRQWGSYGLSVLTGLLGLGLFVLSARLAYGRSDGHAPVALLGGLVTLLVENYRHVLRPELPSLLVMTGLWLVLQAYGRRPRAALLLAAALLQALWANVHGSFVLGPVLGGLYLTAAAWEVQQMQGTSGLLRDAHLRAWLAMQALLILACCATPFGLELLWFALQFGSDKSLTQNLTEWLPLWDPRVRYIHGLWIAGSVWLLTLFAMVRQRSQLKALDWLVFTAFTLLASRAVRFPVYLGLASAFVLPACVPVGWKRKVWEDRWYAGLLGATLLVALGLTRLSDVDMATPLSGSDRYKLSIPMERVLQDTRLSGHVLTTMELGAELVYHAYPRMRPSIDCRVDSYGKDYNDYNAALFSDQPLLDDYVARYDVRYVLMDVRRFASFMQTSNWTGGRWRMYFGDAKAVLLQRTDVKQGDPLLH